jgi:hypothetical protein
MSRKVKEFVEIKDHASLDTLIKRLTEIRDSLPDEAEAVVRMKGDDIFGRLLCVSYFRPQTAEEADCDARYAEAYRESRAAEQPADELGRRRRLRAA